jgi:hypothetical protein
MPKSVAEKNRQYRDKLAFERLFNDELDEKIKEQQRIRQARRKELCELFGIFDRLIKT